VAFIVYEYSDIRLIDRVEAFSSSAITFWLRVKEFDLKIIEEKFKDKDNTVYLRDYAKAFEQVLALRDIAVKNGAWQKKRAKE
jgi:hypothetical protein